MFKINVENIINIQLQKNFKIKLKKKKKYHHQLVMRISIINVKKYSLCPNISLI